MLLACAHAHNNYIIMRMYIAVIMILTIIIINIIILAEALENQPVYAISFNLPHTYT